MHRVVRRERLLGIVFRLVEHARDKQRRPVVVKKIAHGILNAAAGIHRDLLLEHELAIDAAGAAAVQRVIEHGRGIPVRRFALGRAIAHGEGRQRAEFFFHLSAAQSVERPFANVRGRLRRPGRNASEMTASEREAFLGS